MDRTEVMQKLEPIVGLDLRCITHQPNTRVSLVPAEQAVILHPGGGHRGMQLSQKGIQSLINYIGLPKSIIEQIQPSTLATIFTEMLAHRQRYSVLASGGVIDAFTKPGDKLRLNPERVLNTVERAAKGVSYHRAFVDDKAVTATLEVVTDRTEAVAKDDIIQAGTKLTFSPVGTVEPEVMSFAMRQWCMNGAVTMDVVQNYHYEGGGGNGGSATPADFWAWLHNSVRESCGSLGQIVSHWKKLQRERIPARDRAGLVEGMIRRAHLPTEAATTIRAMAIENPPQNSYDLLNFVTYASSHLLQDPRQIDRAQTSAAVFASEDTHSRVCPVCHRAS